ncbi:hypothetical protein AYX15_04963 [Cryptococcus neoformans]|nr:hypothetical protein AYX15_04963 [Cryptococcus neoformans var. grubii]
MSQPQSRFTQQNPNPMPDRNVKAPETISYICGDCGAQTAMQPSEFIRCKECGHRVMYKPRTTRSRLLRVFIKLRLLIKITSCIDLLSVLPLCQSCNSRLDDDGLWQDFGPREFLYA